MNTIFEINKYLLWICFFTHSLFAQNSPEKQNANSTIAWDKSEHNFGIIGEDDGLSNTIFSFTNTTKQPVLITRVTSTCGCTAAEYTPHAIKPGEQGEIKVAFSPQGHPGIFHKAIQVYFQDQVLTKRLFVRGEVINGRKRKFAGYPFIIGEIQLKTNYLRFKKKLNRQQVQSILIINSSNRSVHYSIQSELNGINAQFLPKELKAGEEGEIEVRCEKDINSTNDIRLLFEWKGAELIDLKNRSITISFY